MTSWKSIEVEPPKTGFYFGRYENISFIDSFGVAFFKKERNKIIDPGSGKEITFTGWTTYNHPGKLVKWAEMPLEEE